jgi:Bacteriophage head to tail connecting protein
VPSLAQNILDRYNALKLGLDMFSSDNQDIVNLMLPGAPDIHRWRPPGSSRTSDMFDATALMAIQMLAGNIMGNFTNQALAWHSLRFPEEALQDDQEAQGWMSAVNRHLLARYNASNFYQALQTGYLNYGGFGTMAVFAGDQTQAPAGTLPGLRFDALPHGTYVVAEDADGVVNTLIRCVPYTPLQAIQKFGREHVSSKTLEAASQPNMMDVPCAYLHATYPREDWRQGSLNNRQFPYANVYIEKETQHVCHESGWLEFPYMVPRWEKFSDSPWGFGPGHMALPDTRTLNRMKELQIQMLELWVQPPLKQVAEGVLGSISLQSLAVNVVRRPDDLTTLDITGRPDLIQISQEDLRKSIQDIFYVTALQGLPPPEASNMTAYEVAQRLTLVMRLMGPMLHRLISEGISRLIDRCFALEWRKRRIPLPPASVLEAAQRHGNQIDIEYLGPLARAQKASDVQAVASIYGIGAQIMQATGRPDVFDVLDEDIAIRRAAEAASVPPEMVRDAVAVARMREARQALQQQQQQGTQMQQTTESLRNVAPFLAQIGLGKAA